MAEVGEEPVFLGEITDPLSSTSTDATDIYVSRVGGTPVWLHENAPSEDRLRCGNCKCSMVFVMQAHMPIADIEDRIMYVFACRTEACHITSAGWKVIRAQKPVDPSLAEKVVEKKPTVVSAPPPPAVKKDDWTEKPKSQPSVTTTASAKVEKKQEDGNDEEDEDEDLEALLAKAEKKQQAKVTEAEQKELAAQQQPMSKKKKKKSKKKAADTTAPSTTTTTTATTESEKVEEKETEKVAQTTTTTTSAKATVSAGKKTEEKPKEKEKKKQSTGPIYSLPYFSPYYLDTLPEPEATLTKKEQLELERFRQLAAVETDGLSDGEGGKFQEEGYESTGLFYKFQKRLNRFPKQMLRYSLGGDPLYMIADFPVNPIPRCPCCQSIRIFEFQLLPTLTSFLERNEAVSIDDDDNSPSTTTTTTTSTSVTTTTKKEKQKTEKTGLEALRELLGPLQTLEVGNVLVWSCDQACDVVYQEEFVHVQPPQ